MMLRITVILVLAGIPWLCYAQGAQSGNTRQKAGEEEVLECIEWLRNTPLSESREARKAANAFLMQWISTSPTVHVELSARIVDMASNNPDLLPVYVGGWIEYALHEGVGFPTADAHISGMRSVIDFYRKNRDYLNRDKFIEKLTKQEQKGTMEKFLRKDWG